MTDVFISYSRKDKTFVQKLHDALDAHNRTVWVDWEGIPLSADWWAEIQEAIEGTNAFVFVISPDSVESEVCYKEINAAVALNKRMIPILYREVDAKKVPQEVSSLNWIFLRNSDDFQVGVEALIATMDTDLEWVKAHTRLTRRAMEWRRRDKNDSFLLRGDDLAEAEQLLIQTDKTPPLSNLHGEYVWASRQSAVRRQRIMIGAVTFGLIVAIILGIIAFVNFLNAEQAQKKAEASAATAWKAVEVADIARDQAQLAKQTAEAGEQIASQAQATAQADRNRATTAEAVAYALRDEALSRKLAADAMVNLNEDPELSVLLALEALAINHTSEAENALRQAWQNWQPGYDSAPENIENLQALAHTQLSRQFTQAECQQYLNQATC